MDRRELDWLDRPPAAGTAYGVLPRRTPADTQRAAAVALAVWTAVVVAVAPFLGVLAGPGVALSGAIGVGYVAWHVAPELRPAALAFLVGLLVALLPFV